MLETMKPEQLVGILSTNIRNRRRELGLTQVDLARRVGVTPAYICQIENGKGTVLVQNLAKFAEALATSPGALVTTDNFVSA